MCLSRNWSISLGNQICVHRVVHSILFYPFSFHRICNDVPSFISDTRNLCPVFFFLVSMARGLLILLTFSKKQFLVSFSLLIHCFQFLCSNSYYLFSSAYLGFNLPSFASSLRWKYLILFNGCILLHRKGVR